MSAWLVSKTHIDALVTALVGWELILPDQVDAVGKELWIENILSLEHCYPAGPDRPWAGPEHEEQRKEAGKYVFERLEGRIDPRLVESAASCYDYQSCEHPGWEASNARRLIVELARLAQARLSEYERRFGGLGDHRLPWGTDERTAYLELEAVRAGNKVTA